MEPDLLCHGDAVTVPVVSLTDQIEESCRRMATSLCRGDKPVLQGDENKVAAIIAAAIKADFEQERAINQEAEQALVGMGAAARGMDRGKLLQGIRERLAKQRGFVL